MKDENSFYLLLTLSCTVGGIVGAILGATLATNFTSLKKVAALGTLLDVPILILWFTLDKKLSAANG